MTKHQPATAPTDPLELNLSEQNLLLEALYDKAVQTKQYLSSFPTGDEPDELDSCCDAHLARFQDRISQRESLRERQANVRALIQRVEALQNDQINLDTFISVSLNAITLVYADPDGNTHPQPLTDITEAGTLIDPDTGDDLELVSAVVDYHGKV